MKITNVEKKENSTVELEILVEPEVFEAAVQKTYLKERKGINVPGFRKGKAPRKIIEKMHGQSVFYEAAMRLCYPPAYEEAVKEQKLDEVGYPRMEVIDVDEKGFSFKAIVSVAPEVKLNKYKGLEAPKDVKEITEEDMERELAPFVRRASRTVSVDRAVKDGDTAVIDFEGFDNGVPFDGGKGDNYDLVIGSNSFVPGFEEQVIGMSKGTEKDINITFPEQYAADLAGKDVVFKVKLNDVKETQEPKLDDDFAKDVSEFDTLKEFKDSLTKKLQDRLTEEAEHNFENAILDQLVDNMEAVVPETMVALQVDKLMEDTARRLSAQGLSLDQYASMMGGNLNAMRKNMFPTALHQVKSQLALGAVADLEKFVITDEEMVEEVKQLAKDYSISEEQVRDAVPEETMKSDMRLKKAAELVISEAKVGKAPEKKEEKAEKAEKPKKASKEEAVKDGEEVVEKPKRTRKKKTEETEEGAEAPVEKPKRTRKKKTDEEEKA